MTAVKYIPLLCLVASIEGYDARTKLGAVEEPQGCQAERLLLQLQQKREVSRKSVIPDLHELLPEPILALAWTLFEKEDVIVNVVENSLLVNFTYAGVDMSLRTSTNDAANSQLGVKANRFDYELDSLGDDSKHKDKGMLNMIDMGGSYGIVSIAAYKKHAKHLRLVTVEPEPTTYFFLKWNLYINGVPDISEASSGEQLKTPGVLALNRIPTEFDGHDLHFCSNPSEVVTFTACDCEPDEKHCVVVPSITVEHLAGMFGNETIAMVKMDCEGCDYHLEAMARPEISPRIRRFAGELHLPDENIEELACRWDNGRLVSKCLKKDNDELECGLGLKCPHRR